MKNREWHNVIDRSGWPSGLWNSEPDKAQWVDPETGLPCLLVRRSHGGLCGYVGVAEGHRYFETDYDDLESISVHGGLTFSDFCEPGELEDSGICHVVDEGEDGHVWWLGFDCLHVNDYVPRLGYSYGGVIYRTVDYVKAECANLARQLQEG